MQKLKKFTREELEGFSKEQFIELVLLLQDRIEQFEDRLSQLEKNSSNSSKPPSSDNKSNKNINLREKSGKPSGGQKGHPGITRELVDNPDKIIQHIPLDKCECCGKSLKKIEASLKGRRQVIDTPPIKSEVTEHQQLEKTCFCGHKNVGKFPEEVKAPVQFGPIIQALILYFSVRHHIPYNRIAEIMEEILGEKISERTIENILEEAKVRAGPIYKLIAKYLKSSKYVGSDETGIRVDGINFWLWVWQNELYSYFVVDKSRGYKVIEKYFGENFKGTLGHDCHGAQNKTRAKNHQHCHPHYLRPLKYCIQEEQSLWAYKATIFLLNSQEVRDLIWEKSFDKKLRRAVIKLFEDNLDKLLSEKVVGKETLKIQKRMIKHREKVLFFMTTPDIPPDNNGSERAIRNAKIHKKVSGCFRSETGAQRYAILMSIIDTAKKHGLKMFDACQRLFSDSLTFAHAR